MFNLQAWTRQAGGPPVKDEVRTFDNEADAVAAYEARLSGTDLVILYQDGRKSPVRHSAR